MQNITYRHTCIHTYIPSFHTPSFFVTHGLSHTTLSHATLLTSRSFTTSFVFPSFPVPLQHLLLMVHTLDKNGSLYDPAGTESCDMQIRLVSYLDKDEYMYIYIGLRWPPAATYNCAQVHHRSPAGTFTRVPGRCLRWSPTSQGPR